MSRIGDALGRSVVTRGFLCKQLNFRCREQQKVWRQGDGGGMLGLGGKRQVYVMLRFSPHILSHSTC